MPISECCSREVVSCNSDTTLEQAAALMRKHHIGALVVLDRSSEPGQPVGMLTDRDIVIETVAVGLDVPTFTAGDVMSTPLTTVTEDSGFVEALRVMRSRGVRRLPVVNAKGSLVGVVTADDILLILATEISLLARAAGEQRDHEKQARK